MSNIKENLKKIGLIIRKNFQENKLRVFFFVMSLIMLTAITIQVRDYYYYDNNFPIQKVCGKIIYTYKGKTIEIPAILLPNDHNNNFIKLNNIPKFFILTISKINFHKEGTFVFEGVNLQKNFSFKISGVGYYKGLSFFVLENPQIDNKTLKQEISANCYLHSANFNRLIDNFKKNNKSVILNSVDKNTQLNKIPCIGVNISRSGYLYSKHPANHTINRKNIENVDNDNKSIKFLTLNDKIIGINIGNNKGFITCRKLLRDLTYKYKSNVLKKEQCQSSGLDLIIDYNYNNNVKVKILENNKYINGFLQNINNKSIYSIEDINKFFLDEKNKKKEYFDIKLKLFPHKHYLTKLDVLSAPIYNSSFYNSSFSGIISSNDKISYYYDGKNHCIIKEIKENNNSKILLVSYNRYSKWDKALEDIKKPLRIEKINNIKCNTLNEYIELMEKFQKNQEIEIVFNYFKKKKNVVLKRNIINHRYKKSSYYKIKKEQEKNKVETAQVKPISKLKHYNRNNIIKYHINNPVKSKNSK